MKVANVRARNLKPSIFKNELLATSDPLHAWVFEGLWCLADREGRLEDRPRRIHLEINAGRAYEGTEASLNWLAENGFITRYTAQQTAYIQVVNFKKHQNPHVREPASSIPAPDEHGAGTVQGSVEHQSGPALSPFLIPDSPFPLPESHTSASPSLRVKVSRETVEQDWMLDFKLVYPSRAGDQGWRKAQKAANARIAEGHTPAEFIDGAKRYGEYCKATGSVGTQYVKSAAAFLGPERHFLQAWNAPPTRAQQQQDANIEASLQWLQDSEARDAAN